MGVVRARCFPHSEGPPSLTWSIKKEKFEPRVGSRPTGLPGAHQPPGARAPGRPDTSGRDFTISHGQTVDLPCPTAFSMGELAVLITPGARVPPPAPRPSSQLVSPAPPSR